jgi:hypothetical protein
MNFLDENFVSLIVYFKGYSAHIQFNMIIMYDDLLCASHLSAVNENNPKSKNDSFLSEFCQMVQNY